MCPHDLNRHLLDDTSYGDTGSTLEARYVRDRRPGSHLVFNINDRNTTQLVIRETSYPDDSPDGIDCLSLCGAVSNPTKRGWEHLEPRNGLVKRVFDPWPPLDNSDKGKDKFMVIACDALTPAQAITPGWAEEPPGYASAVTAPFGTTAFRFGTQRICGCTMLFVVSRSVSISVSASNFLEGVLIYDITNFQHTTGKTERQKPTNTLYNLMRRCWIFSKLALQRRAVPVSSVFACLLCDANQMLKPRTACNSTRMTSRASPALLPGFSRQTGSTRKHRAVTHITTPKFPQ